MVKSSIYTINKGGGDDDPYLTGISENHKIFLGLILKVSEFMYLFLLLIIESCSTNTT